MVARSEDDSNPVNDPRFSGVARAYGDQALSKLRASRVCIVGLGGVGSWTVEALARTGVGHLTLVDLD
ncbi:MAG: ThiF family adenylyltransferase, partial [Myxococcota bacterium]